MVTTTRFYLVRHGETVLNRTDCFRGASDVELNDLGRRQAGEVGECLAAVPLTAVLASDLRRAWYTAEMIGREQGLRVQAEPAFRNIDLGPWNGRSKALVRQEEPEQWQLWLTNPERLRIPGAETLEDVRRRAWERLRELAREHAGGRVALVSHSTVLRPLLAAMLEVPEPWLWRFHLDHASITIIENRREARGDRREEGRWRLVAANRVDHLSEYRAETI